MAKQKIVYVISHVHKSLGFEWIAKGLKKDYRLSFILLNETDSSLEKFLIKEGVQVKRITYRNKWDFPIAFLKVLLTFISWRPDVIHMHLLDAQLIGLTAGVITRVKQRIYTRHNSNFHQVYHPSGVKYDRWSNLLATKIVSISQATDETLLKIEKVPMEKVVKIPHGFDWIEFDNVSIERIQKVRDVWKISLQAQNIGVIARHIEWKGIQYIIPAFKKHLANHPESILILANASGPYHADILEQLKDLPSGKVILIPFEEDVAALYKVFNLFVHVPVDSICEAFGQTYIEALASETPSIFTLSGIAAEFIVDERNALIVPFRDADAIHIALRKMSEDSQLREQLIKNGKDDVISRFGISSMISSLKKLYDS